METERFEFFVDRVRRVYIVDLTVNLQTVVVYDHNQVVQFSVGCKHGCLPYLSFLDLAVTKQCIYTVIIAGEFGRDCHTNGSGNTLSKRTG